MLTVRVLRLLVTFPACVLPMSGGKSQRAPELLEWIQVAPPSRDIRNGRPKPSAAAGGVEASGPEIGDDMGRRPMLAARPAEAPVAPRRFAVENERALLLVDSSSLLRQLRVCDDIPESSDRPQRFPGRLTWPRPVLYMRRLWRGSSAG